MRLGKVVGHLWSTKKQDSLTGMKLMIVEPLDPTNKCKEQLPIVAVDSVGAGIGEMVIYATGSSARKAVSNENAPVDAAVLGIVDNVEL